jgi:hypothetical protein
VSIQRWEQLGAEWGDFRLRPDPDGDWVEYTDHQAEMQKAREEAFREGWNRYMTFDGDLDEALAQFLKSREETT